MRSLVFMVLLAIGASGCADERTDREKIEERRAECVRGAYLEVGTLPVSYTHLTLPTTYGV